MRKTNNFGKGDGVDLEATQSPWSNNHRMYSYNGEELPALIAAWLPADMRELVILGHSMGGRGALAIHLNLPDRFKSCSVFSPIFAPSSVLWGRRAFMHYFGADERGWANYDATSLLADCGPTTAHVLIDKATA